VVRRGHARRSLPAGLHGCDEKKKGVHALVRRGGALAEQNAPFLRTLPESHALVRTSGQSCVV
jgi:hypothetical protein